MKLLLNADDLGYTPIINQAIFDLHCRGRLSSASLLINMPHRQNALAGLRAHPKLNVGVHLNLTKGNPLLPQKQIPSLVSPAGTFWPTKQFYARAVARQISLQEVENELRAQIERVLDAGIMPTHLDSHSHWHMLPRLQRLVTRLGEGYQIPGLRQSALRQTLIPSRLWLAAAIQKSQPQSKIRVPAYMLSLHQWMGTDGQPVDLFFSPQLCHLITRSEVTLELVTHPGALHDPDFPPDTLLTHQRQWEVDFLLSPRFDEWLQMMGTEVVDYGSIIQSVNDADFSE